MTSACVALDASSRAGNRRLCGKSSIDAHQTGRSEAEFSQRLEAGP